MTKYASPMTCAAGDADNRHAPMEEVDCNGCPWMSSGHHEMGTVNLPVESRPYLSCILVYRTAIAVRIMLARNSIYFAGFRNAGCVIKADEDADI